MYYGKVIMNALYIFDSLAAFDIFRSIVDKIY